MSTQTEERKTEEMPGPTKPIKEHEWLQKLVGEWRTESEMWMEPGQPSQKGTGQETVKSLGGLWAFTEGTGTMPDGDSMEYKVALGYDVSFKEYRGCWFANVSSHLWKQTGKLSADGKTMTLDCVGPHMMRDGETANYRDVIEIIDDNNRKMTSYGEDEKGEWQKFMEVKFTRA